MKTLSLIIFAVVIYVVVSVEQTTLPVAGRSRNGEQNLEDAETTSTIQKDEFIVPTSNGHARPSLTIEPLTGRRPAKKQRRQRQKCNHQDESKDSECKPVNASCKKNKECCGFGSEGNILKYCQLGNDNKKSCQACKSPGDTCTGNIECCPVPVPFPNPQGEFTIISYKCKRPENANQDQCCGEVASFCPHKDACCSGDCRPGKIGSSCALPPGKCSNEGEKCGSDFECCEGLECFVDHETKCGKREQNDTETSSDNVVSDGKFR